MENFDVLLTGSTGFIGGHIMRALRLKGFSLGVLGRSGQSDIISDLSRPISIDGQYYKHVVHSAGLAHFNPRNESEVALFRKVNSEGTRNLLESLKLKPSSFILISSCSVYGRKEGLMLDESCDLKGKEPYAESKIMAENIVMDWCISNNVSYTILRLPLVVGKPPTGNLLSMINAIKGGWYMRIMNNHARKSMVLAEDIAELVPRLFGRNLGIMNLTDCIHPSMSDFEKALERLMKSKIRFSISGDLAHKLARVGDILKSSGIPVPLYSERLDKITSSITFEDGKAKREVDWSPRSVIDYLNSFSGEFI